MIRVTRLDGKETVVNSELLLLVDHTPDTLLTFSNGVHLVVRETVDEVVDRALGYRRRIHSGLSLVTSREP